LKPKFEARDKERHAALHKKGGVAYSYFHEKRFHIIPVTRGMGCLAMPRVPKSNTRTEGKAGNGRHYIASDDCFDTRKETEPGWWKDDSVEMRKKERIKKKKQRSRKGAPNAHGARAERDKRCSPMRTRKRSVQT